MTAPLRVLELLVSTGTGGGPAQVCELTARLPRTEFALRAAGPAGGPYARTFSEGGTPFTAIRTDRDRASGVTLAGGRSR